MKFRPNKYTVITISIIVLLIIVIAGVYFLKLSIPQNVKNDNTSIEVVFTSEDGLFLGKSDIHPKMPVTPIKRVNEPSGKVFVGWDKDLTNVTENIQTKEMYLDVSKDENVVALPTNYGTNGEIINEPLKILGKVNLCAIDVILTYDTDKLEFIKGDNIDKDVVVKNDKKPGLIYVRFVSGSNVTGAIDLSELKFKVKSQDKGVTDIKVLVKEIVKLDKDNKTILAQYNVLDAKIYLY